MGAMLLLVSREKIQPEFNGSPLNASAFSFGSEIQDVAPENFDLIQL